MLPVDFEAIWSESIAINYRGERAWVMRPEDLLLAASINACRKRFFRLKSLFDIMEIVDGYPALDWSYYPLDATPLLLGYLSIYGAESLWPAWDDFTASRLCQLFSCTDVEKDGRDLQRSPH